jgi:hypothetical protein
MTAIFLTTTFWIEAFVELLTCVFACTMIASTKFPFVKSTLGLTIREGAVPLFTCIAIHGIFGSAHGFAVQVGESGDANVCKWSFVVISIVFGYALLSFYTFMYIRVQAVNVTHSIKQHWMDVIIKFSLIGMAVLIPILFSLGVQGFVHEHNGIAWDGSSGTFCDFGARIELVILLLVLDLVLNVMFAYMFYRPLHEVIQATKGKNEGEVSEKRVELKKILKEVMTLGLTGVGVNFVCLFMLQSYEIFKLRGQYDKIWLQMMPAVVPLTNSVVMLLSVRRGYERFGVQINKSMKSVLKVTENNRISTNISTVATV